MIPFKVACLCMKKFLMQKADGRLKITELSHLFMQTYGRVVN